MKPPSPPEPSQPPPSQPPLSDSEPARGRSPGPGLTQAAAPADRAGEIVSGAIPASSLESRPASDRSQGDTNRARSSRPNETPRDPSRRRFLRLCAGGGAAAALLGLHTVAIEPTWLDVSASDVVVPGLPGEFDGLRIVHLSDLHAGGMTSLDYLDSVITRANQTRADIAVVTGDLTTHDPAFIAQATALVGRLAMPTYVCLGNHDYNPLGQAHPSQPMVLADQIAAGLATFPHVELLRNRAVELRRGDSRLVIIGLEDVLTGRLDLTTPMRQAGATPDQPMLILSHNPDAASMIQAMASGLILAGHTHGGQVRLPLIGALYLNIKQRQFDQGLFDLGRCRMYVSRGVGYLFPVRLLCRPEMPVLTLRARA